MRVDTKLLWKYKSLLFLIAANFIPIAGAVFLGWDIRYIIFLFWAETGIIGFYNILKIIYLAIRTLSVNTIGACLFFIPFFIVHFGGFMLGHGFFLIAILGTSIQNLIPLLPGLTYGLVMLFASHGFSFISNFAKKEWKLTNPSQLMMQPYKRIVLMHITIIFGSFIYFVFGKSTLLLIFLVVLKTVVDITAHIKERKIFSSFS